MNKSYPGRYLTITLSCWLTASSAHALPGDTVLEAESEQANFRVVSIAEGMEFAWDIEFLPDGDLLLSEYNGSLRRISTRKFSEQIVIDAIADVTDRGGLRGITLHPEFASNELLYFCHATGTRESNHTRISRGRFDGNSVSNVEALFDADNLAAGLAHYGCRFIWRPDGTLIATFGDRRDHPNEAQELDNHFGTAVRINDDGSIPSDNPFVHTPGVRHEIWAYGLRNVQGAAVHPVTGDIWVSEHGPYGGDEINILRPGRNYGWPIATFGIDYDRTKLTDTPLRPEVEPPLYYWYPSTAPSSVAFYSGDDFPRWQGDLFVGSLADKRLLRLELLDGRVLRVEDLLVDLGVRIRDVTMGPDGKLYVLTDTGDSRLLRLEAVADPVSDEAITSAGN